MAIEKRPRQFDVSRRDSQGAAVQDKSIKSCNSISDLRAAVRTELASFRERAYPDGALEDSDAPV